MKYHKVAVGGTFDHLHQGHKTLLAKAFSVSDKVAIGITTKEMVQNKKFAFQIEPYGLRRKNVISYLRKKQWLKRSSVVPLHDSYGTSLTDESIEAVIIGPRVSQAIVDEIQKRKDVVRCRTVYAADKSHLSSTRIRRGEIDRSGTVHTLPSADVYLPRQLREKLRKPLGSYVKNIRAINKDKHSFLFSVGDASFLNLMAEEIYPDIVVLDGMINRKKALSEEQIRKLIGENYVFSRTENLAGTISPALTRAIKQSTQDYLETGKKHLLYVRGEDDLAVLPCILFAPLSSVVLYGQPPFAHLDSKPGMIHVVVTEEKKQEITELLSKFTP